MPAAKPEYIPTTLHIDKRAASILATSEDNDDLLSPKQLAAWLGVSEQFLAMARSKGFGPPFVRVGPTRVRYQTPAVRTWLAERTYVSTREYVSP